MLTKQNHKEIAEIIANSHDEIEEDGYWATEGIALGLTDYFIEDNPCFNREKFMKACRF